MNYKPRELHAMIFVALVVFQAVNPMASRRLLCYAKGIMVIFSLLSGLRTT